MEEILSMELEDNVFFLCTQVVHRRNRAIQSALRPVGLMPTEFRVLSAVLRKGPLSMLELASWTSYERTRLTHILHGMEDNGWVKRESTESDRRSVLVSITPAGAALFRKAKPLVDMLTNVVTSGNSQDEIDQLRRTLTIMRNKLLEMGA
ncbi:marR family protein [Paraburkholderia xenovorans LB400]|nr:MarR family transcriptional regulator [Paraburkholderia xenovorans]AIP34783.1 marR family protein [Paraburkholderia xenovorans LB400]